MDDYGVITGCINALIDIERHGDRQKEMLDEAERLTSIAADLDCKNIQILAQHGIDHKPESVIMDIMTENIGKIAEIGEKYGVV